MPLHEVFCILLRRFADRVRNQTEIKPEKLISIMVRKFIFCAYMKMYIFAVVVVNRFILGALRLCIHMHIYNNEHIGTDFIFTYYTLLYVYTVTSFVRGIFMLSTLRAQSV